MEEGRCCDKMRDTCSGDREGRGEKVMGGDFSGDFSGDGGRCNVRGDFSGDKEGFSGDEEG
jgi:hypothetical protein